MVQKTFYNKNEGIASRIDRAIENNCKIIQYFWMKSIIRVVYKYNQEQEQE